MAKLSDLNQPPRESDARDDFWDIEMLVPRRSVAPRRAPGATDTAEISFGGDEPQSGRGEQNEDTVLYADSPLNLNPGKDEVVVRHYIHPHLAERERRPEEPILSYENDATLIHGVKVFAWPSQYRYYQDFCRDAAKYLSYEPTAETVQPVPYFSYVPQYSQLSREQKEYYFYWRREFRRNHVLPIEDSYLYLYLYEIINTAGEETPPEEGLRMLYRVYRAFAGENPRLARLLAEWICDYSLLFRLGVPPEERSEPYFHTLYHAVLKEFYMRSPTEGVEGYADLLLDFCTAYDYKKSHFYKDANRDYFDRYLPGALAACVRQFSSERRIFSETGLRDSHMVRSAFEQALCSYRVRCRIEVDYASFSRSHELRYIVSDILKYTENRLRGFLGIKSRLTVYSLSTEMRKCIDAYCDASFPRKPVLDRRPKPAEPVQAYERLYDLPPSPLSLSNAAEIEKSSWEITRRLTEAFSDGESVEIEAERDAVDFALSAEPQETVEVPAASAPPQDADDETDELSVLLGGDYPFACAAYRGDAAAQYAIAREKGEMPDLIADRINELCAEALGDILLEEDGGAYAVIEDYRNLFPVTTD